MSEIDDLEDLVGTPPQDRTWAVQRTQRRRAEFCNNGHPYEASNTTYSLKGGKRFRRCKTCVRNRLMEKK